MTKKDCADFFFPLYIPNLAKSHPLASSHMAATNLRRVKAVFLGDKLIQPMHLLIRADEHTRKKALSALLSVQMPKFG